MKAKLSAGVLGKDWLNDGVVLDKVMQSEGKVVGKVKKNVWEEL